MSLFPGGIPMGTSKYVAFFVFLLLSLSSAIQDTHDQTPSSPVRAIPRTYDSPALATLEVSLAEPNASPVPVSPDFYYAIPVRPIYKSYPQYRRGTGYYKVPSLKGVWYRSMFGHSGWVCRSRGLVQPPANA